MISVIAGDNYEYAEYTWQIGASRTGDRRGAGRTAFAQADFYMGKTIKIIRGGGPGGSGEFQTRALVRFLEKYIPGKPTLMVEFI